MFGSDLHDPIGERASLAGEVERPRPAVSGAQPALQPAARLERVDQCNNAAPRKAQRLGELSLRPAFLDRHVPQQHHSTGIETHRLDALIPAARRVRSNL